MREIRSQTDGLLRSYPEAGDHVKKRREQLSLAFQTLTANVAVQAKEIEARLAVFGCLRETRHWLLWISSTLSSITTNELAQTYHEGVYLIKKHNDIKDAIAAKKPSFQDFTDKLKSTEASTDYKGKELQSNIDSLVHRWKVGKGPTSAG